MLGVPWRQRGLVSAGSPARRGLEGAEGAWRGGKGPELGLGPCPGWAGVLGGPELRRGRGQSVGRAKGAPSPSLAGCLPRSVRVPRQPGRTFVLENEALLRSFPPASSPQDEGKAQFNALGVIFLVIQGNTYRDLLSD